MNFLLWFFLPAGVIAWTIMLHGLADGASRRKRLLPVVIFLGVTGAIVTSLAAWMGWR